MIVGATVSGPINRSRMVRIPLAPRKISNTEATIIDPVIYNKMNMIDDKHGLEIQRK
jgi:hypothetical protein